MNGIFKFSIMIAVFSANACMTTKKPRQSGVADDMAAAAVIVTEAGGKVTDLNGKVPERYDRDIEGQICSNGIIHDELLSLVRTAGSR